MNKKLLLTVSLVMFFASTGFASANLTQLELQPQSSFTCNATGTIFYSLSNNQLMLCTSGTGSSPVLTSSGSSGSSASFSSLTVSGQTTLATNGTSFVGLGTSSPGVALDVYGTGSWSNSGGIRLTGNNPGIQIKDLGSGQSWLIANGVNAGNDGYLGLAYDLVHSRHNIVVTPSGYVGVETTNPGTTLDVNGNINVGSVLYDRANTNYYVNPSGNIMPWGANLHGLSVDSTIQGSPSGGITNVFGNGGFAGLGAFAADCTYHSCDRGYIGHGVNVTATGYQVVSPYNASLIYFGNSDWIGFAPIATSSGATFNESTLENTYTKLTVNDSGIAVNGNASIGGAASVGGTLTLGSDLYNSAGKDMIQGGNVTDWLRIYGNSFTNGIAAYNGIATDQGFYAGSWTPAGAGNVKGTGNIYFTGTGNNYLAGNVGIGTTTPTHSLEVYSNASGIASGSHEYNQFAVGNSASGGIYLYGGADQNGYAYVGAVKSHISYVPLILNPDGAVVGIGTTTPTTAGLVVSTNVSGAAVDVQNNRIINVGTPINAADAATKSYVDSAITTGVSGGVNGTTNYIAKFTGANTVGNSAIYQSGSSIGIGTTAPGAPLDVIYTSANSNTSAPVAIFDNPSGGAQTVLSLRINNTEYGRIRVDSGGNLVLSGGNGGSLYYGYDSSAANHLFYVGGTQKMQINSTGVGINTSPGTTLDVNGNINVGSVLYDRANTNYYVNPSGNIMPYAANLGGAVNIGGYESVKGTKTDVVTASGTGDLTVALGHYRVGSNINIQFDAEGGWAEGGAEFDLNSTWSSYPQVTVLSDSANYASRLTFYAQPDGSPNWGYVWLFATWVNNSPSKSSSNTVIFRITSSADFDTSNTTSTTGWTQLTTYNLVNTAGNIGIGTMSPDYKLSVAGSMYSVEADNGTATGATTIDWSKSNTQTLVLGASPIALTFNNGQPGAHYTLALKQDATGSRLVTWPGNVRWSSGVAPTLTTTANKTDYVEFVYDGLSSTFDGVGFNANF